MHKYEKSYEVETNKNCMHVAYTTIFNKAIQNFFLY